VLLLMLVIMLVVPLGSLDGKVFRQIRVFILKLSHQALIGQVDRMGVFPVVVHDFVNAI